MAAANLWVRVEQLIEDDPQKVTVLHGGGLDGGLYKKSKDPKKNEVRHAKPSGATALRDADILRRDYNSPEFCYTLADAVSRSRGPHLVAFQELRPEFIWKDPADTANGGAWQMTQTFRYASFPSSAEFHRFVARVPPEMRRFYSIAAAGAAVKTFLDIEYSSDRPDPNPLLGVVAALRNFWRARFDRDFDAAITCGSRHKSDGRYYNSYHIVERGGLAWRMPEPKHIPALRTVMKQFASDAGLEGVVDTCVWTCNRQFRDLGSHKVTDPAKTPLAAVCIAKTTNVIEPVAEPNPEDYTIQFGAKNPPGYYDDTETHQIEPQPKKRRVQQQPAAHCPEPRFLEPLRKLDMLIGGDIYASARQGKVYGPEKASFSVRGPRICPFSRNEHDRNGFMLDLDDTRGAFFFCFSNRCRGWKAIV